MSDLIERDVDHDTDAVLAYSEAELLRDHEGLAPHVVAGRRVHGGFHADGTYQPPRALVRERALDAWTAALRQRGGEPFPADASLLAGVRLPNADQQRVLGELCAVTFRTVDGGTVPGRALVDRFWDGLVRWATVDQPRLAAERVRPILEAEARTHPEADRVLAELDGAGVPVSADTGP